MEKKLAKAKYERNNKPSPCSYSPDVAYEKTDRTNKANLMHTISRSPKMTVTDTIQKKSKDLPGVGRYDPHLSIDKAYRPLAVSRKRS